MATSDSVRVPKKETLGAHWPHRRWFHLDRDARAAYLFLTPLFVLVLGLILYPFLQALRLSFTDKMVGYPEQFVGFKNYVYLINDETFRKVIQNSVVFTVGSVGLKVVTGMGVALLLNNIVRWRGFFRGLSLLPWITSTVIIALTWRWMFDAFRGRGFFNSVLMDVGLLDRPIGFLGSSNGAMAAVIVANWWRGFPFFGITLLAAMQAVPRDFYEAASVDGANAWQRFWHITVPSIKHVLIITTLLSTIWTLNDFNIVYVMTRGGPGVATHVFATFSYETAFNQLRWGRGVAASIFLVPVLVITIIILSRYLLREEK